MYIKEDVVESFMRKNLGSSGAGGTDSEYLQGWILKPEEYTKRLCNNVEICPDWLANGIPPWDSYNAFMSGLLIEIYKQPVVHTVIVGETWR